MSQSEPPFDFSSFNDLWDDTEDEDEEEEGKNGEDESDFEDSEVKEICATCGSLYKKRKLAEITNEIVANHSLRRSRLKSSLSNNDVSKRVRKHLFITM
jgi:hypothetical protein